MRSNLFMIRRLRVVTIAVAVALVPPLLLGGVLLQRSADGQRRARLDRQLGTQRDLQAQQLENYFSEARRLTLSYARDTGVANAFPAGTRTSVATARGHRAGAERAMAFLATLYPGAIGEACVINRSGAEIARVVEGKIAPASDLSADESGSTFFHPTFALPKGEAYQARPYVSPDTHEWVIANAAQLLMPGRPPAFLHFEISVESFRRRAAAQVGGLDLQVLDARSGGVIFDAHTPQRRGAKLGRPGDRRFAAVVRMGRSRGVATLDGSRVSYVRLPATAGNANDWYVVAIAPAGAGGLSAGALGLFLAAALLLVGLGIVSLFTRQIVGRLQRVGTTAAAIAEGRLAAHEPTATSADRGDSLARMEARFAEVSAYLNEMACAAEQIAAGDLTAAIDPRSDDDRLGTSFAHMTERLRTLMGEIAASSAQLSSASRDLAQTSSEAGRAVEETAAATGDVARGAEHQLRMIEAVQLAAAQAAETAQAAAMSVRATQAVADTARTIARDGAHAAQQATEAITRVSDSTDVVNRAIGELHERSDRIGGIVETITQIADQTNLLALNAAIEAARAGEHGRGFAVVADEVRRLAEGTQTATHEIASLVREIQQHTRDTVARVEHTARDTDHGVAIVTSSQEAFEQITAVAQDVSREVDVAGAAIAQIVELNDRMRREITDIAAVAEQSSASAQQVSASSQQTSAATQQIASAAADLATTATSLDRALGTFTT